MAALTAAATWEASTGYSAGDLVKPTTGGNYWYRAGGAGTSDSGEPSWPATVMDTVVDNDITWTCIEVFQLTPDFGYSWQVEDDVVSSTPLGNSGRREQSVSTGDGEWLSFSLQFSNRDNSDYFTTFKAFWTAQGGTLYKWVFYSPKHAEYYLVKFASKSHSGTAEFTTISSFACEIKEVPW